MSQRGARRGAVASFRRLPSLSFLLPPSAFLSSSTALSASVSRTTLPSAPVSAVSTLVASAQAGSGLTASLATTFVTQSAVSRTAVSTATTTSTSSLVASIARTAFPAAVLSAQSGGARAAVDVVPAPASLSSASTLSAAGTAASSATTLSAVSADFSSDFGPFVNYTSGVSIVNGRARISATTAYDNMSTNNSYVFRNTSIFAQVFAPVPSNGASNSIIQFILLSLSVQDGTRLMAAIDSVANTLYVGNEVGYYDSNAVRIAYNATSMAFLRWREASGTVYFDTSPDAQTWTNRSSFADPSYVTNYNDIRVQFVAYQDNFSTYAEVDNVNIAQPVAAYATLVASTALTASALKTTLAAAAPQTRSTMAQAAANTVRPANTVSSTSTLATVSANITATTPNAAPVYRAYTQTVTQQQTTITATKPTSTVAGDLLLAFYMASAGADLNTTISGATAPSGWTQVTSISDTQYTMQKVWYADGGVSNMTFGSSNTTDVSLVIIRITGASTSIVSGTNSTASGSTQNPIAPSVNAPKSVGLLLCSAGATPFTNASFTAPSGMTLITSTISQGQYSELGLAYKTLSTSGATGTQTFTNSTGNGTGWSAVSVVVSQP